MAGLTPSREDRPERTTLTAIPAAPKFLNSAYMYSTAKDVDKHLDAKYR